MKAAALILAAGESSRMGRAKALLPLGGTSFVEGLVQSFRARCHPVIVVLGHDPDSVRAAVAGMATVVVNEDYRQGQLTSMQCGLRAVGAEVDRVLFTLVDHPRVAASTIDALLESDAPLSIPVFEGRKGHPICFRRELIREFLELPPDSQARFVVHRHAGETRWVAVNDPGILDDVDDPAAYERLLAGSL